MDIGHLVGDLFERAGDNWASAYALTFLAMTFDSAKPKDLPEAEKLSGLALFALSLANILSPFLLFVHGFWEYRSVGPIGWAVVVVAILFLVLVSGFLGHFISTIATTTGRILYGASPFVALLVLAVTIAVTWRNVYAALETFVLQRLV
jgi:hypothetical protein